MYTPRFIAIASLTSEALIGVAVQKTVGVVGKQLVQLVPIGGRRVVAHSAWGEWIVKRGLRN